MSAAKECDLMNENVTGNAAKSKENSNNCCNRYLSNLFDFVIGNFVFSTK